MSDVVTYRLESDIGVIAIDNPPVNALGHAVREGFWPPWTRAWQTARLARW